MIDLIKKENYSSEEEYQIAKEQILREIEEHDKANPEPKYDPNYKEEFLKTLIREQLR